MRLRGAKQTLNTKGIPWAIMGGSGALADILDLRQHRSRQLGCTGAFRQCDGLLAPAVPQTFAPVS
jgi:hypothetical protein